MSNFKLYSQYYDLLYKDKDYHAEANYVLSLIKQYKPQTKTVLELGCGTGNHAAILCNHALKVIGLERSAEMVALAQQKNIQNFQPIVADIVSFTLAEKVDVAISLFHVISYLTNNQQLIQCFQTVHQHLNTAGIFMFDVCYSPAVYTQKPVVRVKKLSNSEINITRIAEPQIHYQQNVVDVNYQVMIEEKATQKITTIYETHPMRHFSIPEIALLAEHTGFELIHTEEFLSSQTPSENTWGVCFILRKK